MSMIGYTAPTRSAATAVVSASRVSGARHFAFVRRRIALVIAPP